MATTDPKTFAEIVRRVEEAGPLITSINTGTIPSWVPRTPPVIYELDPGPFRKWAEKYPVEQRAPDTDGTEPDECGPAKTLNTALARLTALEDAVAPVISVFREYLADSFLPDDARVLIDELPLAGLCHGDLRQLMAVWDAGEDEGAAA